MSTNKLIPELRFPEFVNEGVWGKIALEELCDIIKGEQLNRIELTETGRYPCQNGGINPSGYTDKCNTEENTITISEGGNSCGYVNFMPSKFWLGGHCYKILLKKKFNKLFLYQILKYNEDNIMKLRVGSGLPNIQLKAIRNFEFIISNSTSEQQKIASCLSSLDEVIAAHSQKLETLKAHKKGLMQNLFPQEGETVPKYRFAEFVEDGEWREKKLGEIATFVNEKIQLEYLSINSYVSTENLLPDYAGVSISSKLPSSGNFTKYLKGDVLISNIRPYLKKVWFADKNGACSNDVIVIQAKSITDSFLSCLLKNDKFINYIMKGAEGVKMPRGDKDSIREYPILFPQEKAEQQKIASCLSSLDALITAQTEKIEQLKLHKKGLMQGLFPKMSEL